MAERSAPPHTASAHAEATVTIKRGEEIRLYQRTDTPAPTPDRQEHRLSNAQIRIDFY